MTGSKPVALPLGDTPLSNLPASAGSLRRQAFLQGRAVEPTGHETAPLRWQALEGRLRGPAIAECREDADCRCPSSAPRPAMRARPAPGAPRDCARSPPARNRCDHLPSGSRELSSRGFSLSIQEPETPRRSRSRPPERRWRSAFRAVPGGSGAPRPPRPRPFRPWTKNGTSAPSSSPSSASNDGASRKPQISLRATSVVAASELPPPSPPWIGNVLFEPDVDARGPGRRPPGGARAARTARSASGATSAGPSTRRISPSSRGAKCSRSDEVDELKHGLDVVVAVGTAAGDVQEQVELGRRGPGGRVHGASRQSETTTRRRRPGAVISMRAGSASPPTGW